MVVRDLSMQVRRGSIYGFLGPNGSGKTTTIRMLCGLLTPDKGRGTCLGYDILTETDKIKLQVGYMTQRFSLYQDLSVRENLEFVARLYDIADPVGAARAMVERLGLKGREEQLAGSLSGGWKQRLALGACTLPSPKLLLLDEPTAGVDPKARREFWNEIHALAAEGLTVLVSTHYMDEAERCHEIAYIAYGQLLVHGTVPEVIAQSHLTTYVVSGEGLGALANALTGKPGVDMVAPFGTSLHVSGRDEAALEAAIAPYRADARLRWERVGGVAGGRVHRPDGAGARQFPGRRVMNRFARRTAAMLIKEFIQLRRDRMSFGMIIMIPLMQLVLFGYAINTTPRDLPTAVLLQETSDVGRSIIAALQNTRYFKITHQVRDAAEFDRLLASGTVLFAVEIPANFERALRRGERPALLVAADATDPVAAGSALGALNQIAHHRAAQRPRDPRDHRAAVRGAHPCALQSGRLDRAQHRAGPGRHHPDDDHADLHGALGDARDRARHDGEPAVDADHAGRDHARQDRALCDRRLRAGGADHRRRRRCCSACRSSAASRCSRC